MTNTQELRYLRPLRRSLMRISRQDFTKLRYDFRHMEQEIQSGVSEWKVRNKFLWRLWMSEVGDWTYWGGTKVVKMDKDFYYRQTDNQWISKIQKVYEDISEKTNRKGFGRRYFWRTEYPTSLVFFERGEGTEGRHIHTVHHFSQGEVSKSHRYLKVFSQLWNEHYVNKGVGRQFWFETVDSQERVGRYVSKKMSENYSKGWFPVC